MKNNVMLSIYVPTYNHEKYITQALDSILMQKTQYTYEVLVGEDASTDNTKNVLLEYEKAHPNKIQVFYRETNMSKSPIGNSRDLRNRCRGKYLICLEGDDYWIDENKIEKQISFLEEHPEYIAVAHNCIVVDQNSNVINEKYPECKEEEYTFQHYFSNIMPGQYTTVLMRNYIVDNNFDMELINGNFIIGDRLVYYSLLCHGRIYCMQEAMSAYRHVVNSGTSFSARYRYTYSREIEWREKVMGYSARNCSKKMAILSESFFVYNLVYAFVKQHVGFKEILKDYKKIKHKWTATYKCVCALFRQVVLKKSMLYK